MAGKGWTTQVAAAAGVAAGTGAAQLGLGYGLGVVVWPATATADDSVWLGSLGWATWIAASATVFGATIAARMRGSQAPPPGGPWRFALAAAAAIGALLTVALVAVPARAAVRGDTFAPETIAGGYAVIGILLGLAVAYWAVVSRAVAANLVATAGYLWALAAAGVVVELVTGRESATYLTSWQFAELSAGAAQYGTISWPSAILTLLAALVVGLVAAWSPVRRGHLGIGTASSGAVGPLLVAAVFLALAPQLTPALGRLESAYLIAPYAVLSGLAGSAVMVAFGQRAADRHAARARSHHEPPPPTATGRAGVPAQPSPAQPSGAADTHSGARADLGPARESTGRRARWSAASGTGAGPDAAASPDRSAQIWAPPATPLQRRSSRNDALGTISSSPSTVGVSGVAMRLPDGAAGTGADTKPEERGGLFGRWRRGRTAAPTAVGHATAADPGSPPGSGTAAGRGGTGTGPSTRPDGGTASGGNGTAPRGRGSGDPAGTSADRPVTSDRGATSDASAGRDDQQATRSTVAPPPTTPTIARINPGDAGSDDPRTEREAKTGRPAVAPHKAPPTPAEGRPDDQG